MAVFLETISFNHDPASASTDAINLRRNGSEFLHVPEWRRGISLFPSDSVAAYAIKEIAGNTITVQVQLTRSDLGPGTILVRAVAVSGQPLSEQLSPPGSAWPWWATYYPYPWNWYSLWYDYWLLGQQWSAAAGAGSILGEVRERAVTFDAAGRSQPALFELTAPGISASGAGEHIVVWRWQYRLDAASSWSDFAQSSHRVFVLLEMPTLPWLQLPWHPANTQLPWTEALEVACAWAGGATSLDEAATRITQEVYDLGGELFEYGCQTGASSNYSFPGFNCTAYLERLHGGLGNGRYINCSDCATIVSSFANLLGCDLWQSRMGDFASFHPFTLNPIVSIGSAAWQPACGSPEGFTYHEVAWKGACGADDQVFDACLLVDGDPDPTRGPHIPLLPANIRFGQPNQPGYLSRLTSPQAQSRCQPQPMARMRRWVY